MRPIVLGFYDVFGEKLNSTYINISATYHIYSNPSFKPSEAKIVGAQMKLFKQFIWKRLSQVVQIREIYLPKLPTHVREVLTGRQQRRRIL